MEKEDNPNQNSMKMKILVVDDRRENLYAMERTLRALDCEIFTAESGNAALSLTLRHEFALLLLDVNMPEMDGFELAELLRSHEETKQIPIIFVSAINTEDKSVFKGYESGAVDYLFKPVDTDILLSKVKVFLELNAQKKALEAARSELERSNQSLREFAQVVSHDLKNPLNVITGLCELVKAKHSDGMSDRGLRCMDHIAGAADRMTRLINDLLGFAMVNAQPAALEPVDLNAVIEDVIADLGHQLEQTGGRVEHSSVLPVIRADRTRMYQLFQNLIGNGIKYHSPERPPVVRIVGEPEMERPDMVGFTVEDNGIGMKAKDIPLIFEPFQRLDNARGYEGTGLGLATVKKIVDQHRGSIQVSSTPGVGTCIRLTLSKAL